MIIKDTESAQLAHLLLELKDGGKAGEFDNELMQRYGITFENFHKLICALKFTWLVHVHLSMLKHAERT